MKRKHPENEEEEKANYYRCVLTFDVETTSNDKKGVVLQLGYTLCTAHQEQIEKHESILKYEPHHKIRISPFSTSIHKITTAQMQASPTDAAEEIVKFAKLLRLVTQNKGIYVAHNAAYDWRLLTQTWSVLFPVVKNPFVYEFREPFCTWQGVRRVFLFKRKEGEQEQKMSLKNKNLFEHVTKTKADKTKLHSALYDAEMTQAIFFHYKNEF